VSTLSYDTRLRLQKKTDAVGVIDYGYDLADKLKTVTEGSVITLRFWIIIVGHRDQAKQLIHDLSFSKISKFHHISMPHAVHSVLSQ
jgi:YD repeat-containing protein